MKIESDGSIKDLTTKEADRLYKAVKDILAGDPTIFSHDVFVDWCQATGHRDSVMVKTTVFPQKAQQAIIEYYREQLGI